MSSTTAISLANSLSTTVSKLNPFGLNWAIFHIHFKDTIETKGFWGHFGRTSLKPPTRTTNEEFLTVFNGKRIRELQSHCLLRKSLIQLL